MIKTYIYAVAFGGHKSPEAMQRYLEKQRADTAAAEFHQRASAGFSEEQVIDAESQLFALFDRLEANLSDQTWLVADE
ncbi:MAG: hypothetical protein P8M78_09545 [Myxococcota bacterium]|nr:hypothetical protein [Myxococcota bacterium]